MIALVGCTGTILRGESGEPCLDMANQAPAAPLIENPTANRIDVIAEQLTISLSAFSDPDESDTHAASEFEIWLAPSGAPVVRVWQATIEAADNLSTDKLTAVALADGVFDSGSTGLERWTNHIVRARYRDASGTCTAWSEWSEARAFRTDDGSSYLFEPQRIHTFHLDIPPESWDAIDAEARPPDCVPYKRNSYRGTLRFEDQVFENVGIRAKGGCGSSRHLNGKSAFKVNLSWDDPEEPGCPETRRLHGLKRFTFNNLVQDSTFMHETLGYMFYKRMGVPTPRTSYTRLYVNDQFWGMYLHVESLDRRFAARWFESNDGMMYEGTYWCDLIPDKIPPDTDGLYCFSRKFGTSACSTPSDYNLLAELIQAIDALPDGQFYPEIEQFFEFDTLLSSWAVDSIMAHWDGYEFRIMNNYRVYYDPGTSRWTLIPTGIDQTFKGDLEPFNVDGILARRCVQEADCEKAFADKLSQAIAIFEEMSLARRSEELRAQIMEHVMEDPRKEVGYNGFMSRVDTMLQWIDDRPARMRQHLRDRGF